MRKTKARVQYSKTRGITLIALIITVVVMLILAGVAISVFSEGGLFDRIRKSAELYNNSVNDESSALQNWLGLLNEATQGSGGGGGPGGDGSNPGSGGNSGELLDLIYPVGSIYMSVNAVNPSTLFGGTWEAWGNGRVAIGVNGAETEFNTVEKTGGDKSVALTTQQMPTHNHGLSGAAAAAGGAHTHTVPLYAFINNMGGYVR